MPGNDLNTNIPFNPINPGVMPEPTKTERSAIDSVINAFKEMKDTATEGAAQFKALFKSSPTDATRTDVKTSNVVTTFFSKTIPEFGKSLVDHASSLKDRIDNFVNEDKKRLAVEAQYLPALGAEHHEHIPLSDRLASTVKPLTQKLTQLSEAASPTLKALSEKVDSLKSSIPNPLQMFKANVQTEELDDISYHSMKEDIHESMPAFLANLEGMEKVQYDSTDYKKGMIAAHSNMRNELEIKSDDSRKVTYDVNRDPQPAWKLKIDPKRVYDFGGGAKIKGSTLLELQKNTRVTYDSKVVDPKTLSNIIKNGSQTSGEQVQASGRCVVSTDILTHDHLGKARNVDIEAPATFQTYTVNAPNVAYNPEIAKTMKKDGEFNIELWQKEMTRLFTHAFKEAQKDKLEMLIVPAIGMGAFMPESLKGEGAKLAFLNALNDAKKAAGAEELEIVVTGRELEGMTSNNDKIHVVGNKDATGVLAQAIDANYRAGTLNAGDSSGQAGQYAGNAIVNHFAQEEALAVKAPTLMINQNFNANKRVGDPSRYVAS